MRTIASLEPATGRNRFVEIVCKSDIIWWLPPIQLFGGMFGVLVLYVITILASGYIVCVCATSSCYSSCSAGRHRRMRSMYSCTPIRGVCVCVHRQRHPGRRFNGAYAQIITLILACASERWHVDRGLNMRLHRVVTRAIGVCVCVWMIRTFSVTGAYQLGNNASERRMWVAPGREGWREVEHKYCGTFCSERVSSLLCDCFNQSG